MKAGSRTKCLTTGDSYAYHEENRRFLHSCIFCRLAIYLSRLRRRQLSRPAASSIMPASPPVRIRSLRAPSLLSSGLTWTMDRALHFLRSGKTANCSPHSAELALRSKLRLDQRRSSSVLGTRTLRRTRQQQWRAIQNPCAGLWVNERRDRNCFGLPP
jgi:hypothetical protein